MSTTTTGTVANPTLNEARSVESVVNDMLPLASALGPVGTAVGAGVTAIEGVANTVIAESPHQTALTDVINAASAAAPVVAAAAASGAIPATTAQQASGLMALIAELGTILKNIL